MPNRTSSRKMHNKILLKSQIEKIRIETDVLKETTITVMEKVIQKISVGTKETKTSFVSRFDQVDSKFDAIMVDFKVSSLKSFANDTCRTYYVAFVAENESTSIDIDGPAVSINVFELIAPSALERNLMTIHRQDSLETHSRSCHGVHGACRRADLKNFKHFFSLFVSSVVFLCENHSSDNFAVKSACYSVIKKNWPHGRSGGIVLLIHASLQFFQYSLIYFLLLKQ